MPQSFGSSPSFDKIMKKPNPHLFDQGYLGALEALRINPFK